MFYIFFDFLSLYFFVQLYFSSFSTLFTFFPFSRVLQFLRDFFYFPFMIFKDNSSFVLVFHIYVIFHAICFTCFNFILFHTFSSFYTTSYNILFYIILFHSNCLAILLYFIYSSIIFFCFLSLTCLAFF